MGGIDFTYPAHVTKLTLRTLWRQLADPRRPVGERRAYAGPMAGAPARTEQVVSGSAHEKRAAPVGVVAAVVNVLAGDPDRVAAHGGCWPEIWIVPGAIPPQSGITNGLPYFSTVPGGNPFAHNCDPLHTLCLSIVPTP